MASYGGANGRAQGARPRKLLLDALGKGVAVFARIGVTDGHHQIASVLGAAPPEVVHELGKTLLAASSHADDAQLSREREGEERLYVELVARDGNRLGDAPASVQTRGCRP